MKFTKILALVLCFLLVCSPALAQNESEKMKEVLTTAKTILTVPEEYNEFSYRSRTDTDGSVYWTFNWSGEKKGNVDATLSEDGFLSSYYAWIYTDSYDDTLANYTHDEAREIAKEFIKKVNPELYPSLREVTPDGENRNSRTAYFVFREYHEDIPAFSTTVSVTVDKNHGIVRNYNGARKNEYTKSVTAELTEEEAKALYLRDIGIQLEYRMYYDYQEKIYNVFPVYYIKDTSGSSIHAITGEVIEPYFPESYLFGKLTNAPMADATLKEEAAAGRVQFTPEELDALANVGEVYSQEDALTIATEKISALKDYTLRSASLQRDYHDETKLLWYFELQKENSYSYANVQMNAKTGQLLGFSIPQSEGENKNFTKESAKKIAEDFLKAEASDVFGFTEYTEETQSYVPLAKEDSLPQSYYFTYRRMENAIPVNANRLTVRVDANTRQVTSYSRSFTEGLTFPDISTCMSEEEILEIMDEAMEFTLVYLPTEDGENSLAYTFLNPNSQMFDPYTGKILSYDGTVAEDAFLPEYTDIKGHWAEEMILTLLDNGYYISENEFRPDDAITKKEFLKLFQMIGNDSEEQINELIASIEEIEKESADANGILTKQMLSRYFVYRMGYQKVAAMDHIFRYPFLDVARADKAFLGDIALVAGMGIFRGSPDGNFYPQKELTRAEAVSAIYHYLQSSK
ncbi:MAG: S-layer homology domain-containing protein [Clostridia bacterium]|nr:S-layer homology domain-containing protein [Clostridia bacterium]